MNYDELKEKLNYKLVKEFEEYKQDLLKNYTPKEIIAQSYEITFREQIVDFISCEILSRREIKALLNKDNALNILYDRWYNCESNIWELLEDNVRESVDKIATEYEKNKVKER